MNQYIIEYTIIIFLINKQSSILYQKKNKSQDPHDVQEVYKERLA